MRKNIYTKRYNDSDFQKAKKIVRKVCSYMNITVSELRSSSRSSRIVTGRRYVSYLLLNSTNLSTPLIGQKINRSHADVLHHVAKVNGFLKIGDRGVAVDIEHLKEGL